MSNIVVNIVFFIAGTCVGYLFHRQSTAQLDEKASELAKYSSSIKKDAEIITNATEAIIEKLNYDFKNSIIAKDDEGKFYAAVPIYLTELSGATPHGPHSVMLHGTLSKVLKPVRELENP